VNNSNTTTLHLAGAEGLEARFAYRLAARLSEHAQQVQPDVSERLRFAREQALERARIARAATADTSIALGAGGAATLGGAGGWWVRLGSVLPAVLLAAGLVLIQYWHTESQIAAAAEIDADLLADDLPPSAYSDAGFVEFLKNPRD
jgi:fatty acid desaturase